MQIIHIKMYRHRMCTFANNSRTVQHPKSADVDTLCANKYDPISLVKHAQWWEKKQNTKENHLTATMKDWKEVEAIEAPPPLPKNLNEQIPHPSRLPANHCCSSRRRQWAASRHVRLLLGTIRCGLAVWTRRVQRLAVTRTTIKYKYLKQTRRGDFFFWFKCAFENKFKKDF